VREIGLFAWWSDGNNESKGVESVNWLPAGAKLLPGFVGMYVRMRAGAGRLGGSLALPDARWTGWVREDPVSRGLRMGGAAMWYG